MLNSPLAFWLYKHRYCTIEDANEIAFELRKYPEIVKLIKEKK